MTRITEADVESISVPKAAKLLGCSHHTLEKHFQELGAYKLGGVKIPLKNIWLFQRNRQNRVSNLE